MPVKINFFTAKILNFVETNRLLALMPIEC